MLTAIRGSRSWLLARPRGPILEACSMARLSVISALRSFVYALYCDYCSLFYV